MDCWTNPENLPFHPGSSGSGNGGGSGWEPPRGEPIALDLFSEKPEGLGEEQQGPRQENHRPEGQPQELDLFPQEPEGGREEEDRRPEAQPKPKKHCGKTQSKGEFAQTQIENLITLLQQVYESINPHPLQKEQYRATVVAYIGTKGSKALQNACKCLEERGGYAKAYCSMLQFIRKKYGGDRSG